MGLANSDAITSATIASNGAEASSAVGNHDIVASAAVGTGLGNYTIIYVNGTLTVNTKPLTITADDRSKTYGDIVTFAGTEFSVSGLVNSDAITSATIASDGAEASSAVGNHDIVASAAVGTGLGNYEITYVNGTMTVSPKNLTITASNRSKAHGASAAFAGTEFVAAGLVNYRHGRQCDVNMRRHRLRGCAGGIRHLAQRRHRNRPEQL